MKIRTFIPTDKQKCFIIEIYLKQIVLLATIQFKTRVYRSSSTFHLLAYFLLLCLNKYSRWQYALVLVMCFWAEKKENKAQQPK